MNRVCYSLFVMVAFVTFTGASAQVVINEVFYHAPDEIGLEYVELFNHGGAAVDIGGWELTEGVECQFPEGTQLAAGGYLVVANDAAVLKEFFKVAADGKLEKSLSNSGDKLQLKDKAGRLIDAVEYQDRSPWPISPDGYSASLERVYPQGASTAANWAASKLSANYDLLPSGTPGAVNSVFADALPPGIESVTWQPEQPAPKESITVVAKVADAKRLRSVELRYRMASPGSEGEEQSVAMTKSDNGDYTGKIPAGDEANRLLRFRIVATSVDGGVASSPRENDVRPAYTAYVNDEVALDKIPVLHVLQVGKSVFEDGEKYRVEQQQERRGGFGRGRRGFGRDRAPAIPLLPQGESAVIYTDPANGKSEVFDFVNVTRRKSGWKVRLHKDRPLLGMTTMNVLYEPDEATVLNESLAYELYKAAGNASYLSGYMRLMMNGEQAGYHLYFEQPNGNFFRRNKLKDNGDLYKLIWMGNAELSYRLPIYELPRRADISGRHEKKSNRHSGHDDLIAVIEKLENADSDDAMWKIIQDNIDVENMVNYFAVNSLLSHWDGFFNNYFVYFDRKGTGKFSLYPWDQDSTWSQRGGSPESLYKMPVFYGAEGATPDGIVKSDRPRERGFGGFGGRRGGFGGRDSFMWRDGGDFSRPLLANPQFDKLFRQRLLALTDTAFNEAVFGKKIEELHESLEPEVRLRAKLRGGDEQAAVEELKRITDALHEHLIERRDFIRKSIEK